MDREMRRLEDMTEPELREFMSLFGFGDFD